MANCEVAELVNRRSPVDRSGIGKHSIDIRAAIRWFWTMFGFKIRTEVGRAARPPHGVPTVTILERPPPPQVERTPVWCRAAAGRLLQPPGRAPLVNWGIWPQLNWSYVVYVAIVEFIWLLRGLLEYCHVHFVTATHIGGRRQDGGRIHWSLTETRTATAHMPNGLRPTPVSVLTGAGRLVQRAPPESRPKCDRVDFRRNIRSTPWRIWISATFWRFTNSVGDSWICDLVGIIVNTLPVMIWLHLMRNVHFRFRKQGRNVSLMK